MYMYYNYIQLASTGYIPQITSYNWSFHWILPTYPGCISNYVENRDSLPLPFALFPLCPKAFKRDRKVLPGFLPLAKR